MSIKARPAALLSLIALASALLVVAPAFAQETSRDQTPQKTEVEEKVEVRLVEVSVTATDKKGAAITDLKPEDVRVSSRGRDMRIAFVERIYDEVEEARVLPEVRMKIEAPGGMIEGPAETRPHKPHYFIFMIDVENDDKLQRPRAMNEINEFIVGNMTEADFAAVVAFNGKIHVEVPFTKDRGVLTDAINRAYARPPRPQITKYRRIQQLIDVLEECVSNVNESVHTADESCLQDTARAYAEELTPNSRTFLDALEGIVRYAGGLQGRATVFAVSHGVAINPNLELMEAVRAVMGDTRQIQRIQLDLTMGEGVRYEADKLIQLALSEGVSYYFLDRTSAPSAGGGAKQQGFYQAGIDPQGFAHRQPQADMGEVSGATGGAFIINKSVYDGLVDAMEKERGRYTVGFYVDELLGRNDLKKLRVKAKRRGVRLNAGRGTYKHSKVQDTGLGEIRFGKTNVLEGEKKGRFIPFTILAPPRRLGYERAENAVAAQLTLHVIVQTVTGEVLTDAYHFLSHAYPLRQWELGKEEPVAIGGWLEAPPGSYRLIAQLRNAKTGQGGRIVREMKVVVD